MSVSGVNIFTPVYNHGQITYFGQLTIVGYGNQWNKVVFLTTLGCMTINITL
jgi:hypothetical protein